SACPGKKTRTALTTRYLSAKARCSRSREKGQAEAEVQPAVPGGPEARPRGAELRQAHQVARIATGGLPDRRLRRLQGRAAVLQPGNVPASRLAACASLTSLTGLATPSWSSKAARPFPGLNRKICPTFRSASCRPSAARLRIASTLPWVMGRYTHSRRSS